MTKAYQEVSANFNDFESYVIYNKDDVIKAFVKTQYHLFYDTCSILHHSNSSNSKKIIGYLKSQTDTIFITRTVLMELAPSTSSYKLHPTQVNYFKELYESGFKIVIFDEELILDCLKEALVITIEDANKLLGFAVKEISRNKTKIYHILETIDKTTSDKLKRTDPGNKELFSKFFRFARNSKEHEDSLAEELILICFIVLTRIPSGKYNLMSDDTRCIPLFMKTDEYVKKHHAFVKLFQSTTTSLLFKMHNESLVSRSEMIEIIKCANKNKVPVGYVGEMDLSLKKDTFDCNDLVDKIINDKYFRILY